VSFSPDDRTRQTDTFSNVRQAAEVYDASLERCVAQGGFLDRFYELFLGSSEEVAEQFKNTDFERQKEALRASLYIMMMAHCWSVECDSHFEEMAKRHSRSDLNIRPPVVQSLAELPPSSCS
jgi:hypothetical protein